MSTGCSSISLANSFMREVGKMPAKPLSPKQQLRRRKKKREMRKNLKRRLRNKAVRTRVKNLTKEFKKLLEQLKSAKAEEIETLKATIDEKLRTLYKAIDMAYSKGVFHRNEAARRKSRAASRYAKILKELGVKV